ncbi:MAG: aryl-sulfate sulfotransferase, partial [Myxococcales bacterium]|nr:aryl-sulfate sulfotransferase [Myxococcales bacterium]
MNVALLALWGCASDSRFEVRGAEPGTPLTPVVVADLDRPGSVRVRISDSRGVRELALDALAEHHEIPLYGVRAGDALTLELEAFDERRVFASEELTTTVGELPVDFPIVEVLASVPDRTEPGLRLLAATRVGSPYAAWSLALDEAGEVVWALANPSEVSDLRRTSSGKLVGIRDQVGIEMDPLGHLSTVWGPSVPEGMAPDVVVELGSNRLHHELFVLPGEQELLGLTVVKRDVPRFPCRYDAPT